MGICEKYLTVPTKLYKLELLLADCSEEEIEALIPVCKSVITAIRSKEPVTIA